MTSFERWFVLLLVISVESGVHEGAVVKRDSNEGGVTGGWDASVERSLFGGSEERDLEREIVQELNHMSSRKQREMLEDLEKQQERFNVSTRSLVLTEPENLSPVNVEELKTIRKTIKASNSSLPAIRNKRTLNFLLRAVARAMGYTLTPSNPDAEWLPRQQPPPQPCTPPPPPCRPNPPSTPPPCPMPPTPPPCQGSGALIQSPTIPPNQIDANTISYPYRPARTIPLFNFAPLPAGMRVPYPPLLQPPAQQRSSCPPQQPPPPCGAPPPSSPPPCMPTPPPSTPPPCKPATPPPPCGATPPPPPCATTPAPPPPCRPSPAPPCGTTPAPKPPPCATTPAPPPPCGTTPAPSPPPCATTPKPSPCAPPPPPPCANPPPPPPPPPADTPKKGSILLEYDDPVRIQIFSNDKKYLPASGNIFSGHDLDVEKEDWDAYFVPEKEKQKEENYEEKEETEEEHIEEEEEEEAPGQLKHYEEEDERSQANEEEDESETSLSIVKKPAEQDIKKINRRRLVSTKTKTVTSENGKKKEKEDNVKEEKGEKSAKMKTPKRKKWVRIVKKQRRKTKTDSSPQENFQIHTSDSFPAASHLSPLSHGKRDSHFGFGSFERDVYDYSADSSSDSAEDSSQIDFKKVTVNNQPVNLPQQAIENRGYEFNINPYALEPEEERRKKLEKAVERYVEDYVEKQLGDEIVKNTGIPKTTVFEFTPKNGPKIQTITTTVAKTSHTGSPANFKPQIKPEVTSRYKTPNRNSHVLRKNSYEENFNRRGDASYEAFNSRK